MNVTNKKVRALGLCSGGLDSMLSGLVLRQQGIEVEWVSFETPFFMDCHTLMFRLAGEMMPEGNFDFLFSGEVLGQRPMSQNKQSLHYVAKHSGHKGYILRPLSAKNLPETVPEKEGLVDRGQLLDIAGRGRKRQIELAQEFRIPEYPAPAGGCLLTDKNYSIRLREIFEHQATCSEADLHLLRYGRHFRLNPENKLIVGRTENDNEEILKHRDPAKDVVIDVKDYASPIGLVHHAAPDNAVLLAASICTGYSKAPKLSPVDVVIKTGKKQKVIQVIAIQPGDVRKLMIK